MGTDIYPAVQRCVDGEYVVVPHGATAEERSEHPLENRNYRLFAAIAGVRNYAYEYEPIAPDRGFPEGIKLVEGERIPSCPKHVDRAEPIVDIVDGLRVVYRPEAEISRCGDCLYICGRQVTWVTLRELLDYEWPEELKETDFCMKVIPWLQSLGKPEDVRIVMGFD